MAPLTNDPGETPKSGGQPPPGLIAHLPTLVPLVLLALALFLPGQMFQSDQRPSDVGLGPAFWPDAMLWGLGLFSGLWIARDIWAVQRAGRRPTLSLPREDGRYDYGRALAGLVMIVAYGWLLPVVGFAVSTAAFIAIWCLFGGLRKLLVVVPVTLIGTLALLWLFMGLALMPLPRGSGAFDTFSIWLLRATGIY